MRLPVARLPCVRAALGAWWGRAAAGSAPRDRALRRESLVYLSLAMIAVTWVVVDKLLP